MNYSKQIKKLREKLIMSQSEFAQLIGVSFSSVNRWEEIFGDPTLTAAMVDRLAHKSTVINIKGDSYRIKETKDWLSN